MGLQIRTYVNGEQKFIDLYDNEDIKLNTSFAEIQDITKKNSTFTKEFKIPGSKTNNDIFNYFYDLNTTYVDWDTRRKFEADLLYDGYELYNGYVRLNSVNIVKTEKIYSITFYSSVGDLAANIGDKPLSQLDTTELNHFVLSSFNANFILSDPGLKPFSAYPSNLGWDVAKTPITTGDVYYTVANRGYDYTGNTGTIQDINTQATPIVEFSGATGFFDNFNTPLPVTYLIPSVRTRKLYEMIVNQAGYTIESEFLNTDYMARYYIQLSSNTDKPFMAQAGINKMNWESIDIPNNTITGINIDQLLPTTNFYGNVDVIKPTNFIDLGISGFNPFNLENYGITYNMLQNVSDALFAIPYNLGRQFQYTVKVQLDYLGGPIVGPQAGNVFIWEVLGDETFPNQNTVRTRLVNTIPIDGFISGVTPDDVVEYTLIATTSSVDDGELSPYTSGVGTRYGASLYLISYEIFFGFENMVRMKNIDFKVDDTGQIVTPRLIELNKEMNNEYKQIEFIQDINKEYNLVMVPHPIKPKTLIIEPMVNYIGKGKELDWTDKVDFDSPIKISPTTDIINGTLKLKRKEDKDFVNTEFLKKSNLTFGEAFIELNTDFKDKETNITQKLGQNTDYYLETAGNMEVAFPCYFISKEKNVNGITFFEYRPFKSLYRNTFMSLPIPRFNLGTTPIFYRWGGSFIPFTTIGLWGLDQVQNINRLTTYPYSIKGFSHYTVYDSEVKFLPDEIIYPELESMYDRYYKDYIDDLTSDDNKVVSLKMKLDPYEVASLYHNEVIVIKNTKFRVNKINNLNLSNRGDFCDVELVKLTKDYTPTPVLYFDLIKCSDPSVVIHTNTNLSYLTLFFQGLTVAVRDSFNTLFPNFTIGFYLVVPTQFNPNVEYKPVFYHSNFITQGTPPFVFITRNQYLIYEPCGNIIDEIPTEIDDSIYCFDTTLTNTNDITTIVPYVNCAGDEVSVTLSPNQSITVCMRYGSVITPGIDVLTTLDECTDP